MKNIPLRLPILPLVCVFLMTGAAPLHGAPVDFLVPGISLRSVSLLRGARVSYLVISDSFGATDSSYVELRVLAHQGGECELEIISAPYPVTRRERITIRLRLSERVTSIASGEEFRSCLREIHIKEGTEPFRAPSARELDDLDLERLFIRSAEGEGRTGLGPAKVATPAGAFLCDGARLADRQSRLVNLGGVEAERTVEKVSEIWISNEVPLWGLVKSRVEERSFTKASGDRAALASPRVTVTQSILLSFKKPRAR